MVAAALIGASASGQGKTTVTAALARLHASRGAVVRCFKCGPDFLDPLWLERASGAPVDSLDLWINGDADCAHRLDEAASHADLVLVEGVMGVHDGQPSAADLAIRFGLPVIAVVDASAMAGTFAAIAHGLRIWRPEMPWMGVLANRVAGERHARMLSSALREPCEWLGSIAREPALALRERHLGLTMPHEDRDADARLNAAVAAIAETPLGRRPLREWPAWHPPTLPATPTIAPLLRGRRIAIAHDAAFAFVCPVAIPNSTPLASRSGPTCATRSTGTFAAAAPCGRSAAG
jgi:cobyrinic acid a,c-diamide synthase